MKKIFLISLLVLITGLSTKAQDSVILNSQHNLTTPANNTNIIKDHSYYKAKAGNKSTTAIVLLSSGAGLVGLGFLIGDGKDASLDDAAAGGVIAGVGLITAIVSIPFFISSTINRHKAKISLKSEHAGVGIPGKITGLSLSIAIKR